ncbi:dTDP-glucose 4,6-dehydratase [Neolewinella maritima]|uniref:dTDP-glucose 4,6-dehydratase n=1 Tax=Neolewinella maritima TaxID=1383882 RepID=A0ABN8F4C7_9BACT|nr:dTDP-glucose 4,6-dehydratase [Neolewinella maritima]CAH0998953.1 dTDP-glucose 4,6-dehydratase [Neolewinella maritima]
MSAKTVLVTGGAGFIGSHLVRHLVRQYPDYTVINLDALTYAGHQQSLSDVVDAPNYCFVQADVADLEAMRRVFQDNAIDWVVHLAAESHVDRSISDPLIFVRTNTLGTATLLQVARESWQNALEGKRFYHVSTDEVYGSLGPTGMFTETTPYDPRSPYSASKAASDHLVRAWYHTYDFPVVISNCSNNYGPYQLPEKLIPLFIRNIVAGKPLPVYGQGSNVRDWLYVADHVRAIDLILHQGVVGQTYNIGGHNEWKNIDLVRVICRTMDRKLNRTPGDSERLITYVTDRAGHDQRYAIDASKMQRELGWVPEIQFEEGIERTIDWYLANARWITSVL